MDKNIYRMSSVGHCPRALSAEKLNQVSEDKPEWLLMAAAEGNLHEMVMKSYLMNNGYAVFDEQEEIKIDCGNFELLGHIDGKTIDDKNITRLLECKSMSQFEYQRWEKGGFNQFLHYADQITCYMTATGLNETMYWVKNRSSGYIDKRLLTGTPAKMQDIINRITIVDEAVRNGKLVNTDYDINSLECRRCSFKSLCITDKVVMTDVTKQQLEEAAATIREGNRLKKEGELRIETAKATFENYIKLTGNKKFKFNGLLINTYESHRDNWDTKFLKTILTNEQIEAGLSVSKFPVCSIRDLNKEED